MIMNTIDIGLGVFFILTLLIGLRKGLIASIIHLIALVFTFILIAEASPYISFLLHTKFNLSELVSAILSYIIVLVVIIILTKLVILLLNKLIKALKLSMINRILGAVFGFCNGVILLAIVLLLISISPFQKEFDNWSQDSKIIDALRIVSDEFSKNLPDLQEKKLDGIDELIEKQLNKEKI